VTGGVSATGGAVGINGGLNRSAMTLGTRNRLGRDEVAPEVGPFPALRPSPLVPSPLPGGA
jgi:hypothetical protein